LILSGFQVPTKALYHSFSINRTEGDNMVEKLVRQDKDRKNTHQSPSWAKQA